MVPTTTSALHIFLFYMEEPVAFYLSIPYYFPRHWRLVYIFTFVVTLGIYWKSNPQVVDPIGTMKQRSSVVHAYDCSIFFTNF